MKAMREFFFYTNFPIVYYIKKLSNSLALSAPLSQALTTHILFQYQIYLLSTHKTEHKNDNLTIHMECFEIQLINVNYMICVVREKALEKHKIVKLKKKNKHDMS